MKTLRVTVDWPQGLHARVACRLVRLTRRFHAVVRLRVGRRVADARSVLSLLMLCATLDTAIDVEAHGEDEDAALKAVERLFAGQNR